MFIVHVHCSLFMFIVHCSHGATLIFDDLLKYKGRKARKLYPLTLFQDSNMMFTCLLVERQGKVELTDTNDVLAQLGCRLHQHSRQDLHCNEN